MCETRACCKDLRDYGSAGLVLASDERTLHQAMLRALLDVNLVVRHAAAVEQPHRAVGNILPLVLPSREQHR